MPQPGRWDNEKNNEKWGKWTSIIGKGLTVMGVGEKRLNILIVRWGRDICVSQMTIVEYWINLMNISFGY